MNDIDRFLSCSDLLIEDDLEYILHTQQPRVLFRVLQSNDYLLVDFEITQEYDRLADCTQEQIDELMGAMRDWYINMCKHFNGEIPVFEGKVNPSTFTEVELDDAYFTGLLNNENQEIPTEEEINAVTQFDYVKVSKEGEKFWCAVWYFEKNEKILFVTINEELLFTPIHGLKEDDAIIIEPRHIYEIRKKNLQDKKKL